MVKTWVGRMTPGQALAVGLAIYAVAVVVGTLLAPALAHVATGGR